MKKLLAFFIVLSFLVPSVFADLTVKGNAYGQLNVLQVYDEENDDNDDVYAKLGRGDDNGDGVRTRLDLTGSAGEGLAGYRLQLNWHTLRGTFGMGDWAYGWVKPLGNDFLQVNFGRFNVDTLRGKQGRGAGAYGAYSHESLGGEEEIFRRFTGDPNGLVLISNPIEGFTVGFGIRRFIADETTNFHKSADGGGKAADAMTDASKAGVLWEKFHLAAGYDIPGIGLARLGLLAAGRDDHRNSWTDGNAKGIPYGTGQSTAAEVSGWTGFPTGHLIQAAFQLKALESTGLSLDFGFGLPIAYKVAADNGAVAAYKSGTGDDTEFQAPLNIALGGQYALGDLAIRLRTDLFFAGSYKIGDADKQNLPLIFSMHLGPSYTIQNIGRIGVEFGFNAYGAVKDEAAGETLTGGIQNLGFGGWFQKDVAGGIFRIGLTYLAPLAPVGSFVRATDNTIDNWDDAKTPGIFTVPVLFELAF
jgi:hypothetical protein